MLFRSHNITNQNWSFTPYYQLTVIPSNSATRLSERLTTQGFATIVNYQFPSKLDALGRMWKVNLPLRLENLKSSPPANFASSDITSFVNARSATVTPTFQSDAYFLRTEISYTKSTNSDFYKTSNARRLLIELGILH